MGEGYHATIEWGFWKFIKYIGGTALITALFTWASTRFFNLDYALAALYLANIWVTIPVAFTGFVAFLIWRRDKQQSKRREKQQAQAYLDGLKRKAGGENQR